MKLSHVKIKDFRSFSGEHNFDFAEGVNYVVGPNNCGKSNLVRALEVALDPTIEYDPERDRPVKATSAGPIPMTRITLTFKVGVTGPEKTLLRRAETYERALKAKRMGDGKKGGTYAASKEVRLVTTFGADGARQVSFQARGVGAVYMPQDSEEHRQLEQQFRSVVRFGVIHSGQDLESLLKGKFRQILQLVIEDHLMEQVAKAESARRTYLESLQSELLEPLRSQVEGRVGDLFPEITVASLIPDVPTVQETLSSVDVRLGDLVSTTGLTDKGTGVRGAVLLSMLQYMAEQSRRSLVMAVEEPEAFLHPAGQDAIRSHLEDLATRSDISLVVTTHSPYVVSRRKDAMVTELRKGADGFTRKGSVSVDPHERMADLLGGLFRDAAFAQVLEDTLQIPATTRAVVVTEGFLDGHFIRETCRAVGRDDLIEDLHFVPAGGAQAVLIKAIVTAAATGAPVIALLDFDEHGRETRDRLKSLGWRPSKNILVLNDWPKRPCNDHDIEIEDLLPLRAVDASIATVGLEDSIEGTQKCKRGKLVHRALSTEWKRYAGQHISKHLRGDDPGGMIWLAEEVHRRADTIRNEALRRAEYLDKA